MTQQNRQVLGGVRRGVARTSHKNEIKAIFYVARSGSLAGVPAMCSAAVLLTDILSFFYLAHHCSPLS